MRPMKRPYGDIDDDPVIVLIPGDDETTMDEWLASLPHDEPPIELPTSAADLLAEVRREAEWSTSSSTHQPASTYFSPPERDEHSCPTSQRTRNGGRQSTTSQKSPGRSVTSN